MICLHKENLFYHPVKFEINRQKHLRVQSPETEFQDGSHVAFQNCINLESNLAYVVSYHTVKFQINQRKCLQVRVWKANVDGQMSYTPI